MRSSVAFDYPAHAGQLPGPRPCRLPRGAFSGPSHTGGERRHSAATATRLEANVNSIVEREVAALRRVVRAYTTVQLRHRLPRFARRMLSAGRRAAPRKRRRCRPRTAGPSNAQVGHRLPVGIHLLGPPLPSTIVARKAAGMASRVPPTGDHVRRAYPGASRLHIPADRQSQHNRVVRHLSKAGL